MDIGFDFDKNFTKYNASCDSKSSNVTFTNKQNQVITLNFTRSTKTNSTYLSGVAVSYDIDGKYFPQANSSGQFTQRVCWAFKKFFGKFTVCVGGSSKKLFFYVRQWLW